MRKTQTNTDLFGERLPPDNQPLAATLKRHDRETFDYRLEHLQYLNSVFPKGLMYMLPPETHFLFQEIKAAFVAGHCISVILLTQAFIEHYYQLCLQHSPHASVADRGLAAITECLRQHHLEHAIILDRIDILRRIRNPLTHLKEFQHPHTLSQRALAAQDSPINLMEQDAKDSLDALFAIFQHTRFKP
jgi:hypothetical protein